MLGIKIVTRIRFNSLANLVVGLAFVTAAPLAKGDWRVVEQANPLGPGQAVDVLLDGKPVARS